MIIVNFAGIRNFDASWTPCRKKNIFSEDTDPSHPIPTSHPPFHRVRSAQVTCFLISSFRASEQHAPICGALLQVFANSNGGAKLRKPAT